MEVLSPKGSAGGGRVKFTAVVVTYNEERYLKSSLESLSFCDQLVVVDLGSTDSSVRIAREAGAEVLNHERVPVVEKVREYALKYARNDWVVFQDPDEVMPEKLARQVGETIVNNPGAAMVRVPLKFYFRGKQLNCCVWGFNTSKVLAVHKKRVILRPLVHRGYEAAEGFKEIQVPMESDNYVRHYWMHSWAQLFEKHRRYIEQEGESRYRSGQRFSWPGMTIDTLHALKINLIDCRGLLGGFTGMSLSFFYGWYVFMSWLSLRRYESGLSN